MAKVAGSSNGKAQSSRIPPVHEVRIGRIKGTIWQNQGSEGPWYSVSVTRSYKDGDTWKQAHAYGRDDLLVVAEVARACFLWIASNAARKSSGDEGGSETEEAPY